MIEKNKRYENRKMLDAAKGQPCTANFPECNYEPATTVPCHLNESFAGKGMGQKADDDAMFFGCSHCHDLYDRRRFLEQDRQEAWERDKYFYVLRAVVRTRKILREKGV